MPALLFERPDDFLQEFATLVELWRGGAYVRSFRAIFDEPSIDAQIGDQRTGGGDRRFATTQPALTSTEAHLGGAKRGDEIRIAARRFDVLGPPEVQGDGWALLRLSPQLGSAGR